MCEENKASAGMCVRGLYGATENFITNSETLGAINQLDALYKPAQNCQGTAQGEHTGLC